MNRQEFSSPVICGRYMCVDNNASVLLSAARYQQPTVMVITHDGRITRKAHHIALRIIITVLLVNHEIPSLGNQT